MALPRTSWRQPRRPRPQHSSRTRPPHTKPPSPPRAKPPRTTARSGRAAAPEALRTPTKPRPTKPASQRHRKRLKTPGRQPRLRRPPDRRQVYRPCRVEVEPGEVARRHDRPPGLNQANVGPFAVELVLEELEQLRARVDIGGRVSPGGPGVWAARRLPPGRPPVFPRC